MWRKATRGAFRTVVAALSTTQLLGRGPPRRHLFGETAVLSPQPPAVPRRFAALWGNGDYGRLGLGGLGSRSSHAVCPFFSDDGNLPVSVACGGAHTLFLTGLSYDTNESTLKDAFGQHGHVIEVNVICDRVSGKSKGFGFVKFALASEASRAFEQMDGQMLDGRHIRVEHANRG